MESEKIINIGPICRFGPGGDYTSNWPQDWEIAANQPQGALAKLLNMLFGMIESLRGTTSEQGIPYYVSKDRSTALPRRADAEAGPGPKHNHGFSEQILLFADDWRAGRPAGYKQNNRIRAHRAAAKKRSYITAGGQRFDKLTAQSTLFDSQLESAKTA
jgi:hypothetical protein